MADAPGEPMVVVCGVEDSAPSRAAAATAAALARATGARLQLVHVAGSTADAGAGRRLLQELAEALDDVEVECHAVGGGEPARQLALHAERAGARLLVVGQRGSSSGREALLGSVSARLAADAPCPVLVQPDAAAGVTVARSWAGAHVVCGVDGSDDATRGAWVAAGLAERLGGSLAVVRVVDSVAEEDPLTGAGLEDLWRWARAGGDAEPRLPLTRVVRHGDVAEQLERVAGVAAAPLIVVGARGRPPHRAQLLGYVARQVLRRARRPVVIVPAAHEPVAA
jgi:nucleotide-binding universal stress UspA family protein